MVQVLFAGNLGAYGTLTPSLLGGLCDLGVEPYVISEPLESDLAHKVLAGGNIDETPVSLSSISPQIVHVALTSPYVPSSIQKESPKFRGIFPDAKFVVSFDGTRISESDAMPVMQAAHAAIVPHLGIIDSFCELGDHDVLLRKFFNLDRVQRVFSARPGIAVEDLDDKNARQVLLDAKKTARSARSAIGIGAYMYAPNITDPKNLKEFESRKYFRSPLEDGALLFVASSVVEDPYAHLQFDFIPEIKFINLAKVGDEAKPFYSYEAELRHASDWYNHKNIDDGDTAFITGAMLGLFPIEPNSGGFTSVHYSQMYLQALRAGVFTVAANAFTKQLLGFDFDKRAATGNSFVAGTDEQASFAQKLKETSEFLSDKRSHDSLPQLTHNMITVPANVVHTARDVKAAYERVLNRCLG